MKTRVQILAQMHENYGAHNWSGEGDCPQAWKPKGGQMFTLNVDSDSMFYAEEQCVEAFKKLLAKECNDFYRYEYTSHELIFHEPSVLCDTEFEALLQAECKEAFN
jgi:hypothetical protein